jgi:hypothetical protein
LITTFKKWRNYVWDWRDELCNMGS